MKHEFLKAVRCGSQYIRGIGYEWDNAVGFALEETTSLVILGSLKSYSPSKGDGSRFMDWFTNLADIHNTSLYLTAVATEPLRQNDLIGWYERYGFEKDGGSDYFMLRKNDNGGW